jgi:hypothetical protein
MTPAQTPNPDLGFSRRLVVLAVFVALLFGGYYLLWAPHRESLVVYCAHDSIYADSILREFERETGISIAVRYDTEATKSLGLVELLLQEKAHPRCDVFSAHFNSPTKDCCFLTTEVATKEFPLRSKMRTVVGPDLPRGCACGSSTRTGWPRRRRPFSRQHAAIWTAW